jgi:hypothetical protein
MSSRRDTERVTRTSTPKKKDATPERYTTGGEFSSDDEVDAGLGKSKRTSSSPNPPSPGEIGNMELKDAQELVKDLSDKDLFDMMKELKQAIGPIVDSTRPVYQHLLTQILAGKHPPESVANGNGVEADEEEIEDLEIEFSDSDQEEIDKSQTTPKRESNNFTEYYQKFVSRQETKSAAMQKENHEADPKKFSFPLSKKPSPAAGSSVELPTRTGLSRSRDSPKPSVPPVPKPMYRPPTPNPQLAAVSRATAKIGAGDEAEPTVLKRKTVRKILNLPKHQAPNAEIENANPAAPGWVGIAVLFALMFLLMYGIYKVSFPGGLSEDEIIDREIDELVKNNP